MIASSEEFHLILDHDEVVNLEYELRKTFAALGNDKGIRHHAEQRPIMLKLHQELVSELSFE